MKLFGKPRNRWGRVRIASIATLAVVLAVTLLAAVLGSMPFSALDGFELAMVPLLVGLIAGWLEDQDQRAAAEHAEQRAGQQELAARQEQALRRVREAVESRAEEPAQIAAAIQAALDELNGKGRGELLRLLYDEGVLRGDGSTLQLGGMVFSGAVLRHADLRGARLAGCDLSGVKLEGGRLQGADLSGAKLAEAFLKDANLTGCTVQAERLDAAILIDTILPDGRKLTNEKGKAYLRSKEIAMLIDKL